MIDHWLSDKLCKADFWVDLTHYGAQFCASLKQVIDFPNLWQYGESLFADRLAPQGAGARKCASISPRVRGECGADRCCANAKELNVRMPPDELKSVDVWIKTQPAFRPCWARRPYVSMASLRPFGAARLNKQSCRAGMTGWFVAIVDQRGHKVGADRRLRSAQTAYRRRQKPQ